VAISIFMSTILIQTLSPSRDGGFSLPLGTFSAFEELEAKCWLCGNGFISTAGGGDLKASQPP
jgi:hypothetical protein